MRRGEICTLVSDCTEKLDARKQNTGRPRWDALLLETLKIATQYRMVKKFWRWIVMMAHNVNVLNINELYP